MSTKYAKLQEMKEIIMKYAPKKEDLEKIEIIISDLENEFVDEENKRIGTCGVCR